MFAGTNMTSSCQTLRSALFLLLLSPIVWAIHLFLIYFAHTVLCTRGVAPQASEIVIAIATLAALIAVGSHLLTTTSRARKGDATNTRQFQYRTSAILSAISIIGILWAGFTPIFVQACATAR
jgi:hypothetical protein